jgi:hydroxymethylpyrimidine/phosphomethylpyrimidine kinase
MTATGRARGRVLIVAGSDSGGGAGIQADIKTVTCLGGYAATAITALTAQDTRGVHGVVGVDPAFIQQQMRLVLNDIGADCIKTGMLHNAEVIAAVAEVLAEVPDIPAVVDPVMVAQSGASLLEAEAVHTLVRDLVPRARLITPNLPEAEKLIGTRIADADVTLLAGTVPASVVQHLTGDTPLIATDSAALPDSSDAPFARGLLRALPRIDPTDRRAGDALDDAVSLGALSIDTPASWDERNRPEPDDD